MMSKQGLQSAAEPVSEISEIPAPILADLTSQGAASDLATFKSGSGSERRHLTVTAQATNMAVASCLLAALLIATASVEGKFTLFDIFTFRESKGISNGITI